MPRSYAKLLTAIWDDADFCALDEGPQRLYMMLMSQPDLSIAGAIAPRFGRWARRSKNSTPEGIAEAFGTLVATRFVCHDPETEEALIRSFIRHDGGYATPNIHKAIVNAIANIESVTLQIVARDELARAAGHKPYGKDGGSLEGTLVGRDGSSQQPAAETESFHLAASSRAGSGSDETCDLPANAAAAVDLLIAHRTITAPDGVGNAKRYALKIRRNLDPEERQILLAEAATGAEPDVIARRAFGLSEWQTRVAANHIAKASA